MEHLDFWAAIITLIAIVYFGVQDKVLPIVRSFFPPKEAEPKERKQHPVRSRPLRIQRPIRRLNGRFAGSRSLPSIGNDAQRRSEVVTASESDVPPSLVVTSLPDNVTVSTAEAAIIAIRLSQGMSPSDVAKSLPGYSPKRNYQEYKAKVDQVKASLEEVSQPVEQAPVV